MQDKQIKELVKDLRKHGFSNGSSLGYHSGLMDDAANTIEQLQAENERLKREAKIDESEIKCTRMHRDRARAEAITEFAERLCEGRVSNDPVVIAVKTELIMMKGVAKDE